MKLIALLVVLCASMASAFVVAPTRAVAVRTAAVSAAPLSAVEMTSVNKKAKAANRKQKSCRAAVKRFKVTSTGKLLRHYAGKAHLLRKKRPQHLGTQPLTRSHSQPLAEYFSGLFRSSRPAPPPFFMAPLLRIPTPYSPALAAKLRKVGQCDATELKTYQKLLLVVPPRK